MMTNEKKLWWLSLYVLADRAMLPTSAKTEAGFYLDTEPIVQFDYRNRDALLSALRKGAERGNPVMPTPPSEMQKQQTPMEKWADVRSWPELERRSIYFSIKAYPSEFRIKSWGRASDGTWAPEKETVLDLAIPASAGIEAVADAILDHLGKRSDLPGLPITRTA